MPRATLDTMVATGRSVTLDALDICAHVPDSKIGFPREYYYVDANLLDGSFTSPPGGKLYDGISAGWVPEISPIERVIDTPDGNRKFAYPLMQANLQAPSLNIS
jgi:hypothetical protein